MAMTFEGYVRIADAGPDDTDTLHAKDDRLAKRVLQTWLDTSGADLIHEPDGAFHLRDRQTFLKSCWTRRDDAMWFEFAVSLGIIWGNIRQPETRKACAARLKELWMAAGFAVIVTYKIADQLFYV